MRCTQVKLPATFADYHLLKSLLSTLKVFSLCFCCVRPVNRCAREIKYIAFLPSGIKPTIVTPTGPGTKGKYSGVMISFIFTLSHHYIVRIEFANEPMAIYVSQYQQSICIGIERIVVSNPVEAAQVDSQLRKSIFNLQDNCWTKSIYIYFFLFVLQNHRFLPVITGISWHTNRIKFMACLPCLSMDKQVFSTWASGFLTKRGFRRHFQMKTVSSIRINV